MQIALQLWLYLTPVAYPLATVPARFKWLFMLNPLSAIIDGLRLAGGSVIEREDARLIAALLHCDQLSEAARELDVSVRTVRNHRAAMIHRLRGALAA